MEGKYVEQLPCTWSAANKGDPFYTRDFKGSSERFAGKKSLLKGLYQIN